MVNELGTDQAAREAAPVEVGETRSRRAVRKDLFQGTYFAGNQPRLI